MNSNILIVVHFFFSKILLKKKNSTQTATICLSQHNTPILLVFVYSVLNLQYLLLSHVMLLFPHWEHEEGPHNGGDSTRLDKGPYIHKHTPIPASAQNQRFYSTKASYRSHCTGQGTSQSSFNAQQNMSLPKGPCYYTQQPTCAAE